MLRRTLTKQTERKLWDVHVMDYYMSIKVMFTGVLNETTCVSADDIILHKKSYKMYICDESC